MLKYSILIVLILGLFSDSSCAKVLIIEKIKQTKSFDIPSRGMTMNQVISKFDEPETKKPAIGKPPITEWKYARFSVYFEKTWVINAVVYKASPDEKGSK